MASPELGFIEQYAVVVSNEHTPTETVDTVFLNGDTPVSFEKRLSPLPTFEAHTLHSREFEHKSVSPITSQTTSKFVDRKRHSAGVFEYTYTGGPVEFSSCVKALTAFEMGVIAYNIVGESIDSAITGVIGALRMISRG